MKRASPNPIALIPILLAVAQVACTDNPPPITSTTQALSASIYRLAPDDPLGVPYWPFADHVGEGTPTLDALAVGAQLDVGGCGALEWPDSPIPDGGPGPYCVGRIGEAGGGLVVVGRPGGPAYMLVPGTTSLEPTSEGFVVERRSNAPSAELIERARQWAAAPGAQ